MTNERIRLALVAASPIYYQVPLYRLIANDPRIDFTAIFASSGGVRPAEMGFGKPTKWDVDLLSGYRSVFLRRAAINPIGDGNFFTFRDLDVVRTLWEGNFDVLWLFGYNYLTHVLAAITELIRRRPVLFREEQTLIHSRSAAKLLVKRLALPRLFRRFSGLYIGAQNRQWLQQYGVPQHRLYPVPYCVDNDLLRQKAYELQPARARLRANFGLNAEQPVVVMVSRLIAKKQPLFVLEAFARVRALRQCSLLIVGSGPLEHAMRKKVDQERIPDVVFTGFLNQSEVAAAYACADIFVLASKMHETWGIVVNEAMNFGLPVIVTDKVGCAVDLVRPDENGYIVDSESTEWLERALLQLLESSDLRRRFGEASLRIVAGFSYERAKEGLLHAVADAVGPGRWSAASAQIAIGRGDH